MNKEIETSKTNFAAFLKELKNSEGKFTLAVFKLKENYEANLHFFTRDPDGCCGGFYNKSHLLKRGLSDIELLNLLGFFNLRIVDFFSKLLEDKASQHLKFLEVISVDFSELNLCLESNSSFTTYSYSIVTKNKNIMNTETNSVTFSK